LRNERRFHGRRARRVAGSAVAIGALAASGVMVGVGLAGSPLAALDTTTESTSTPTTTTVPTTGKVAICHRTRSKKKPGHMISVSVKAWPAHMRHGDTLGACVAPTPPTTSGTTTTGSSPTAAPTGGAPGQSGVHGHGGNGPGNGKAKGHNK
jgi:hypothetical protein